MQHSPGRASCIWWATFRMSRAVNASMASAHAGHGQRRADGEDQVGQAGRHHHRDHHEPGFFRLKEGS